MRLVRFILSIVCAVVFLTAGAKVADRLICLVDRDVYASGDQILVSLFVPVESDSRIVYVDLAGFSGNHISGVKLLIENHRAEGYLTIPDSVRTGTYLLRSFINYDHRQEFFVRDLFIANRFEDFSSGVKVRMPRLTDEEYECIGGFGISVPEKIKRREKAQLNLAINPDLMNELAGGLDVCISNQSDEFQSVSKHLLLMSNKHETIINESRGIVISGKVINKESQLPVSKATVFLSVPDSIPGFQYDVTRSDGRFVFLLKDIYGKVPMVIQVVKDGGENLKLVLDDKFKLDVPDLPIGIIELDNNFNEEMVGVVESFTIRKIFNEDVVQGPHTQHSYKTDLLFYGDPTYVIVPDQFYNLHNFSEISKELLVGVKFRDKNEKLLLNLVDRETSLFFDEQAFVLIDGIPVQDMNILKDMGTSNIGWIHTVLESRFYGDMNFPGVVSVHTTKDNLGWLSESDRLIKFDFEALQIKGNEMVYGLIRKIPDMRPVLLWETDVKIAPEMQFDFKGSDIKGTFRVRVSGKKKSGELVVSEQILTVI